MGVYFKNMQMARDCPMYPMAHYNKQDEFTGCDAVPGKRYAAMQDKEYAESSTRPDWCTAVKIKGHGRLIDKDVMCNECRRIAEEYDGIYPDCTYCPAHLATTVIPAEEGE